MSYSFKKDSGRSHTLSVVTSTERLCACSKIRISFSISVCLTFSFRCTSSLGRILSTAASSSAPLTGLARYPLNPSFR